METRSRQITIEVINILNLIWCVGKRRPIIYYINDTNDAMRAIDLNSYIMQVSLNPNH